MAVHLLLAMVPLGMGFMPIDYRTLPIVLGLASIPFSQIMLLSIWVGMIATGKLLQKAFITAIAGAFLACWCAWGEVMMSTDASVGATVSVFLRIFCVFLLLLAILSAVMAGMSRLVGTIRLPHSSDLPLAEPRFRFSLFTLLAVATTSALILGLVRASRDTVGSQDIMASVVELTLGAIIFALNTLVAIWATLGSGHVGRRLCLVFFVSVLLGFSFAIGTGMSSFGEPWWLFLSFPLVVIVPTTIVALSLLYLRRLGFRLVPPQISVRADLTD
jgi:hypothetical protein